MRTLESVSLEAIDDRARQLTGDAFSDYYAKRMQEGEVFPPVNPSRNQHGVLRVCDGRHRIAAARKIGRSHIEALIDSNRD
jgi:hypothetical protein